jgi:uncharacterized protein (DUF2141 family)
MKRIIVAFALAIALSAASLALAQNKCTVSGEVVYSGDSNIYVLLLNSKTFAPAVGRQKELPPSEFVQIVKATMSGKASFAFKDVPKREYVVHTFADKNSNAKIDTDTFGSAIEPRDYYKPMTDGIIANWYEQKFAADKDITDIMVKLRD